MKIKIDDQTGILDIQQAFSTDFPFLKIEFFRKPHELGEPSPISDLLPSEGSLKKWRTAHNGGTITFTPETTVQELEKSFQEQFGISAQVFRKSGKVWLETSATDGWKLKEQNEQGAFMHEDVGE